MKTPAQYEQEIAELKRLILKQNEQLNKALNEIVRLSQLVEK
jgi:hypothetical protein